MRIKLNTDEVAEILKTHIEERYAKPGSVVEVEHFYISGGVDVTITAPPKVVEPAPSEPNP